MSTRSKAAVILASAGVLFAGWQIGTANGQTVESTTTTTDPSTGTSSDTTSDTTSGSSTDVTAGSSDTSSSGSTSSGTSTGVSGTFTGATASNQYGNVTVTVTLENGVITDVAADANVYDNHSRRYVQTAIPVLREEVLAANSADVNLVSGATFTSEAYLTSLQSALDQAGR